MGNTKALADLYAAENNAGLTDSNHGSATDRHTTSKEVMIVAFSHGCCFFLAFLRGCMLRSMQRYKAESLNLSIVAIDGSNVCQTEAR